LKRAYHPIFNRYLFHVQLLPIFYHSFPSTVQVLYVVTWFGKVSVHKGGSILVFLRVGFLDSAEKLPYVNTNNFCSTTYMVFGGLLLAQMALMFENSSKNDLAFNKI
jgi:hypothetical protein